MHWVVKNKSRLALALPAIELTLTDLADQPVIRRVFTPTSWEPRLIRCLRLVIGQPRAYLRVKAEAAWPPALGYRLLVFYP